MSIAKRQRILPPYTPRVADWRHGVRKLLVLGLVLGFAVFYGLAIAVLPQQFMSMLLMPIGILILLALWVAPDLDPQYDNAVRILYIGLIFVTIVWPYYLALDILGLPWITAGRFMQILLFTVSALLFSMSARARKEVRDVASSAPIAVRLWMLTFVYVVLTMPLNGVTGFTEGTKLLLATLIVFLLGCLSFRCDRTVLRIGPAIIVAAIFVCFFGLGEYVNQRPIWADHIPNFLRVEDQRMHKFLAGQMKTLDGRPRVGSSFGIPLWFGEFLGMAAVFTVHYIFKQKATWRVLSLLALLVFIFVCAYICNARSAFISIIGGLSGYYFIFALNRYLRGRTGKDVFTPAYVFAIPAAFAILSAAVLFVARIRVLVLGASQHQWSDRAREEQWETGLQLALAQPWGYGPGTSGILIGWGRPEDGEVTVDSTHIWLIVDYGFIGMALFVVAYFAMLLTAMRAAFGAEGEVERMALPAFGVMTAFLATRYGIASYMNIYIVFAMFALSASVLWRQRARAGLFQWAELRSLWSSGRASEPASARTPGLLAPQS